MDNNQMYLFISNTQIVSLEVLMHATTPEVLSFLSLYIRNSPSKHKVYKALTIEIHPHHPPFHYTMSTKWQAVAKFSFDSMVSSTIYNHHSWILLR